MLPQHSSRNIIQPGGCNMKRVINTLNICLLAMCGYVYGYHHGFTAEKPVDLQMQIRYAVAQAMIEGQ